MDINIHKVEVFYDFSPNEGLQDKVNKFLGDWSVGQIVNRSIKIGDYGQTQIAFSYDNHCSYRPEIMEIISADNPRSLSKKANDFMKQGDLIIFETLFSFYKDSQKDKPTHVALVFYHPR